MKETVDELRQQLVAAFVLSKGPFSSLKEANRAVTKIVEIYVKLRCHGEEGYLALEQLLEHSNPYVRKTVAYWTYPRNPERSLKILREIADSYPPGIGSPHGEAVRAIHIIEDGHFTDPVDLPKHKAKYEKAMEKLRAQGKK